MAFGLDDLIKCLATGDNLDIGYHRVFGGQILAQMITAAADASPDKVVKSINVLFPREGDTSKRMEYRVDKLQDGRTFGTTTITATQDDKVISAATVSMHVQEDSPLHRSDELPTGAGGPESAMATEIPMIPWEVRIVGAVDLSAKAAGPAEYQMWMRATGAAGQPLAVQQALLAHATDLTVIGTALRPFEGLSQADSTVTLHTAVTSHSVWFHQPVDMSEWVLVSQTSPVVAGGRAFGRGEAFNAAGEVVASFAQESMVRPLAQQ